MSWLYGQTWLWYLIAFLVGVLLAWLFLVRPQQRRLDALQQRTVTAEPVAPAVAESEPVAEEFEPVPAQFEPVTAVDPALSTLDSARAVHDE